MSEEDLKKTWSNTATTADSMLDLESVNRVKEELEARRAALIDSFPRGIKILEDPIGMLCSPNEYVIVVGAELYKKLKNVGSNE